MKYFLDCEFIEDGKTIDLISIGIVCEDGREFYVISTEFEPRKASDWVVENVLRSLPPMWEGPNSRMMTFFCDERWEPKTVSKEDLTLTDNQLADLNRWMSRSQISKEIERFAAIGSDSSPEFWGEWCSYDWVALCQLFGTMMDLLRGWPMRCRDVVQLLEDDLGLSQDDWPKSLETDGNHNALLGAKTVKARYEWCMSQDFMHRKSKL